MSAIPRLMARKIPAANNGVGPEGRRTSNAGRGRWWVRAILSVGNLHRRIVSVYAAILGPRLTYAIMGLLGGLLYRLLSPLRIWSEAQCGAALAGQVPDGDIRQIARKAFVHRIWDIADLMLADRLLHPGTFHHYGGRIPQPHLAEILAAQARGQPAILLTAYYGPFDLLPIFLGFNGIHAAAVYLPHENRAFDAYRRHVRARGGCELVTVDQAASRFGQILDAGGSVAIIADHHAERRGLPVKFLGLPTLAMRSVGLMAWRFNADVVVAGIRRQRDAFRFEIVVADTIKHEAWQGEPDPVTFITERYLADIEQIILADPTQYLWSHARWGRDFARQLVARSGG